MAPNPSPFFLQTSVPSATKWWDPGSQRWRRCGSSTTLTVSPAGHATGSWPASATTKETGGPRAMPATRYPSFLGDNQRPQRSGRCSFLEWQLASHGVSPQTSGHAGEMCQVPGADCGAHCPCPGQGLPPWLLLLHRLRPGHRHRELRCGRAGRGVLRGRLLQVSEHGNGGASPMLGGLSSSSSPYRAHAAPVCSHQEICCSLQRLRAPHCPLRGQGHLQDRVPGTQFP